MKRVALAVAVLLGCAPSSTDDNESAPKKSYTLTWTAPREDVAGLPLYEANLYYSVYVNGELDHTTRDTRSQLWLPNTQCYWFYVTATRVDTYPELESLPSQTVEGC